MIEEIEGGLILTWKWIKADFIERFTSPLEPYTARNGWLRTEKWGFSAQNERV